MMRTWEEFEKVVSGKILEGVNVDFVVFSENKEVRFVIDGIEVRYEFEEFWDHGGYTARRIIHFKEKDFVKITELFEGSFEEALETVFRDIIDKLEDNARKLKEEIEPKVWFEIYTDWGEVELEMENQRVYENNGFVSYKGIITDVEPKDIDIDEEPEKYQYIVNFYKHKLFEINSSGWWEVIR